MGEGWSLSGRGPGERERANPNVLSVVTPLQTKAPLTSGVGGLVLSPGVRPTSPLLRAVTVAFVCICLVGWTGCTPRRPIPTPTVPDQPPPIHELLASLNARLEQPAGLRGLAKVTYRDVEQRGSATQAIAVALPDRFRLESFSLLGVAALHVCDGRSLAAYLPRESIVYRGAANPTNVARFTRLHLSPGQVVRLLLGLPPFAVGTDGARVRAEPYGRYRVDLPHFARGHATLWFDAQTGWLRGWEVADAAGDVRARGELDDYRPIAGGMFPFTIRLSDPNAGRHVRVEYRELTPSPALPDALFTVDTPAGIEEIDLDAEPLPAP